VPPPRPHPIVLAALAAACSIVALLMLPGAVAHASSWRWPLRGPVVGAFHVTPRAPFVRGQRRGIDLAAAPGSAVRAACPGRVTFAGALPRLGLAVSVRCGALVATYLRLGRLGVRRGAVVLAGERLNTLGRSGRLRLGARRAADRRGYVDPRTLLGDPGATPPDLAPVRRARRPRAPRAPDPVPLPLPVDARPLPARPRAPLTAPSARAAPTRAPLTAPSAPGASGRLPWPAYPALALIATALPVGGLVRRRRGRLRSRSLAMAASREGS